jgi:hypothetical protein
LKTQGSLLEAALCCRYLAPLNLARSCCQMLSRPFQSAFNSVEICAPVGTMLGPVFAAGCSWSESCGKRLARRLSCGVFDWPGKVETFWPC